ncbi:MAG TPA: F0F1 ATP synthase subunit A [Gemmatimonadales bacterium]|nr:F0F1 ATP synthase subunit A [Gemmatimonadales bacterium]
MTVQEPLDIGEVVLHHTADAWTVDLYPFGVIHLPRWPDIHIGGLTLNLSPTKHVVYMAVASLLVFLTMRIAARGLERRQREGKAPGGFAGAVEALVLFVRNDIVIANIGHDGAKFAPFVMTLFFFILYSNLLGLLPWGATPTGNLAVTGALALLAFVVIEISGLVKLGPKGYLHTIFPTVPGVTGVGAVALSIGMAPIEIIGKLVKPFALAVRLFGNMTAGHFVILSLFGIIFLFGGIPVWNWGISTLTIALVTGIMLLELIVALLQAYVFALLTSVFIGLMQHEH